tara:strand:+ start:187 stop:303 length:117 start_codon:yes stop_codon:yes gene_type:complete
MKIFSKLKEVYSKFYYYNPQMVQDFTESEFNGILSRRK